MDYIPGRTAVVQSLCTYNQSNDMLYPSRR